MHVYLIKFIKYAKVYIIQKGSLEVNPNNKTPLKKKGIKSTIKIMYKIIERRKNSVW